MEFTLLGAALVAAAFMYGALRLIARRDPAAYIGDLWDVALAAIFAGLVAGRLVAMVRQGASPFTLDFALIRAGVDTVGATIGALGVTVWLTRDTRNLGYLASAALVGLAGWHAGCLVRGTCLGTPTDLPWAWSVTGSSVTRHPVELYAAGLLLLFALVVYRVRRKNRAAASLALAAAAGIRLLVFPLQATLDDSIVWWYGATALVALAAAFYTARPLS